MFESNTILFDNKKNGKLLQHGIQYHGSKGKTKQPRVAAEG
jgi:hypothetical protein